MYELMEPEDSAKVYFEEVGSDNYDNQSLAEEPKRNKRSSASKQRQRILKAKKLKRKEFFKPPTKDELNALEEYDASIHSSILRLQIEELLTEVKLKEKTTKEIFKWFSAFKQTVSSISDSPRYDLGDLSWNYNSGICFPLKHDSSSSKGIFQFCSPEKVELVGSFPLALTLNAEIEVDVLVVLPKKFFQHDDFKNHRYHRKRASYVTCLALLLRNSDLVEEMSFEHFNGDILKPTLIIKPKGKLGKQILVKILISPPDDYYPLTKLAPTRCNLKLADKSTHSSVTEPENPTPHYNNSVMVDALILPTQEFIAQILGTSQGVRDGILLLKIWLHQRHFHKGFGAINSFVLIMFVAYLLQTKQLHPLMSSYQVARNTWLCLSQSDWTVRPISCCQDPKQPEMLNAMSLAFPVVFADFTGNMNVCAGVEKSTFFRVKHEAELAMKLIETTYNFDALFMTAKPFLRTFDHIVRIKKEVDWNILVEKFRLRHKLLDYGNNVMSCVASALSTLLLKGLGKRVVLLAVEFEASSKWSVTSQPPCIQKGELKFGLLLDPEQSINILDKGPAADSIVAEAFRDFWGSKSELRRFQDGTICEAVVWDGNCLAEKRLVCEQVVRYILKKHAGIQECNVDYIGGQLDSLLNFQYLSWPAEWSPYGTGEEAYLLLLRSFESLGSQLRSLQGLPLSVTSVQGVAPSFRYTEVFPPLPTKMDYSNKLVEEHDSCCTPSPFSPACSKYIPCLDVLLFMEGSGKWPDDVEAVRRIKAAFYLKLAEELQEQCGLSSVVHSKYIDVFKDGYVYRLMVTHKREVTLLKMEYTSNGMLRLRDNDVASLLERQTLHLPKLTSTLHGLQLHQSTFSAACRLAKRWISSQLLCDHVPEIVIELIVAYLYISPGPFTHPRSPQVAFQRFLNLLAKHEWKSTPLIVNLNSELTKEEVQEIQSKFLSTRSTLPLMFIATPYDKLSSVWTKTEPNTAVVHRMSQLAAAAVVTLEMQLLIENADVKQIFRPSLAPYDVIIHLKCLQIPLRGLAVDVEPKTKLLDVVPYQKQKHEKCPVAGYNPVQCYLRELREAYEEFAAFFYDNLGGEFIAVLWKPGIYQSSSFSVSRSNCRVVCDAEMQELNVVPNVEAVLEDFAIIGRGLVKSVEIKPNKWRVR